MIAASDTKGWVEDPEGIDYQVLEDIYNKKRSGNDRGVSLAMYVDAHPSATWHAEDGRGVWQLPCDIALPCARENTLLLEDAQALRGKRLQGSRRGRKHAHNHRCDQLPH